MIAQILLETSAIPVLYHTIKIICKNKHVYNYVNEKGKLIPLFQWLKNDN